MSQPLAIHRYRLEAATELNARHASPGIEGVLIRSGGGFACLQPWVALGDEPLDFHLDAIARGLLTPAMSHALAMAATDAEARAEGRSLWPPGPAPENHATVPGAMDPDVAARWWSRGFRTFKVKLGPAWFGRLPGLLAAAGDFPVARWRFDFNASLTRDEFLDFARALPESLRLATDFVEDPCPFEDGAAWIGLEAATGLRLAADRWCAHPAAAGFIGICKPARDNTDAMLAHAISRGRPMVVTSNMDHPIGIAWAAVQAARFQAAGVLSGPCGLCTHLLFPEDAFSRRLGPVGNRLGRPGGAGLGFGDLLAALDWEILPGPEADWPGPAGQ